jgi:hypothetical protein
MQEATSVLIVCDAVSLMRRSLLSCAAYLRRAEVARKNLLCIMILFPSTDAALRHFHSRNEWAQAAPPKCVGE